MLFLLSYDILSQPPIELYQCTVHPHCSFCLRTPQPQLNIIHPSEILLISHLFITRDKLSFAVQFILFHERKTTKTVSGIGKKQESYENFYVFKFYSLNDPIVFLMPSRASTGSRSTPTARLIFSFDDT